ncbi:hypothetical protein B7486_40725 [cyanobacterium TDX16]|nr:hypothetical protein B7486_40725 [cyanobacterium TDX16]
MRRSVRFRLLLSILFASLCAFLFPSWLYIVSRILCIWNVGMACFLGLTWRVMFQATPNMMSQKAKMQDAGRLTILSLVTAAACASLLAIGFILHDAKNLSLPILVLHTGLSVVTIIGSWLLVHTIFAMHYAHEYYQDDLSTPVIDDIGGLEFPQDTRPDYWDFLYYSFVIGMTSQVSDVQVTSRAMRRLTLIHGVLSFFFNTAILAMSINIIAGLL